MALEVYWSEEAENQLDEIIQYLEENWSEKDIRNFFKRLEDSIEAIKDSPYTYKLSQRKKEVREFQLSSQTTIFYSLNEDRVNLLLLWPNKRNPENLQ